VKVPVTRFLTIPERSALGQIREVHLRAIRTLIIAAFAATILALGAKTIVASWPTAGADSIIDLESGSVSVDDLHRNPRMKELPVQEIQDPI